jgi:hypothetical protein
VDLWHGTQTVQSISFFIHGEYVPFVQKQNKVFGFLSIQVVLFCFCGSEWHNRPDNGPIWYIFSSRFWVCKKMCSVLVSSRMPSGCWSHVFSFHAFRGRDETALRGQCRLFRSALPHALPWRGVRLGAGPWARPTIHLAEALLCDLYHDCMRYAKEHDIHDNEHDNERYGKHDGGLSPLNGWIPEIRLVAADGEWEEEEEEEEEEETDETEQANDEETTLLVRCPRLRIVAEDAAGGRPGRRRAVFRAGVICQNTCAFLALEGLVLRRRGLAVRGKSRVVCRNVDFCVATTAVSVQGGALIDLEACRIRGKRGHGVSVIGVGTTARLQDVTIVSCGRSGVWAYMGARVEIARSDVSRCKEYGLHAQGKWDFPSRIDVKRGGGKEGSSGKEVGKGEEEEEEEEDRGSLFTDNARGDWFEQSAFDRVRWC